MIGHQQQWAYDAATNGHRHRHREPLTLADVASHPDRVEPDVDP